jgi:hypothetical protein
VRGKWPGKSPGSEKEAPTKGHTWKPSAALVRARWRFAWRLAFGRTGSRGAERRAIQAVLDEHAGTLLTVPGVIGTALGESSGQPYVRVLVVRKTPELVEQIPSSLEGYAVAVEETGGSGPRDRA